MTTRDGKNTNFAAVPELGDRSKMKLQRWIMELNVDERKEQILSLLHSDGKVRVSDLSRMFNVSEVTIRMDLTDL